MSRWGRLLLAWCAASFVWNALVWAMMQGSLNLGVPFGAAARAWLLVGVAPAVGVFVIGAIALWLAAIRRKRR